METVLVSPKFQVVIPKSVRESIGIKAGTRVQIMLYGTRIELIPLRKPKALRGYLRGIDTTVKREKDRL
jgi:AbrB family looped-hinge helix DNA binding protein